MDQITQGAGWSVEQSRALAREHLSGMGSRWSHVQGAGLRAQELRDRGLVDDDLVSAAWLHDIGYAPGIVQTGFHPLDGARYLQESGTPAWIVALVAAHTGAEQEAAERGLLEQWSQLPVPDPLELEVLTLIDLVTSPNGEPVLPGDRIAEILTRYAENHEVHHAVKRSGPGLVAVANRAKARLGLPDHWPMTSRPSRPI